MADLRDRLLAEIDRRLAKHEPPWDRSNHAQALRALRREMERHQVNPLAGKKKFCVCCEAQAGKSPEGWIIWQWPCPSILETAREMGVGDE